MKRFLTLLLAAGCTVAAQAQIRLGDGQLTGSFETNTIYYVDDNGLGEAGKAPKDHFGSNNYLKADYTYGRFSAGLQADAYLPALQGYEIGQQPGGHKFYLSSKYIQWQDKNFSVLVGDIFDQFGNGLIYRSYEDRQLGFNNSVEGIRGIYRFGSFVELKGLYGRPRLYTDYTDSWVRGADLKISIADIAKASELQLTIEGSYVNRYEGLDKDEYVDFAELGLTNPNLNMYSGRLNLDWKGLSLRGEYAVKSTDLSSLNQTEAMKGHASLVELGYYYKGFSFSGQFRELDHMGTLLSLYGNGTGNTLNYLPALTRQYTYMLANLNPYQVNVEGEIGGQVDVYYTWRNPSNRHRYWNFHANYSTFYTRNLSQTASSDRHELLWRDANFDIERQWNRTWKTTILYSFQEWNPYHGAKHRTYVSNIFVADVTCKISKKSSLRAEVQYLLSDEYEGDWVAGLLEYNLAPRWSIFFQDMYNLDATAANNYEKINYYSGGFSYTKSRTRIQLSYGRNRAGYICSGGVCRYSPAYTGVNLAITSSF
ncbi:DUF6029 family protein [uncultured Alistipes sp.]|uniref:DUF6029 family protein n=1 Tax=uncultured Alistipes sp. TaxID=538949 RepID=UPI0025DFFD2B|nr:DUF6029 family protein [uncultured Alistipes sp.]